MAGEAAYSVLARHSLSRSYVQPELRQALPKGQCGLKDWTERDRDTERQRDSCPAGTPVSSTETESRQTATGSENAARESAVSWKRSEYPRCRLAPACILCTPMM